MTEDEKIREIALTALKRISQKQRRTRAGFVPSATVLEECVSIAKQAMMALAALPAGERAWQPIETAPKDGAYVLIFNSLGNTNIGHWNRRHLGDPASEAWVNDGKYIGGHPLYWMPLPKPPHDGEGPVPSTLAARSITSPSASLRGEPSPINMPFERVPQHESDIGFGPVSPRRIVNVKDVNAATPPPSPAGETCAETDSEIESLISIWSICPSPNSESGKAWAAGARAGWQWALDRQAARAPAADTKDQQ